jgi:predicted RNA-binding Zn ribbon-like protein
VNLANLKDRPAATINLIGGRLCLDFVNSIGARRISASGQLTIRDEKLNSYEDLVAWAHHAGALGLPEAEWALREAELRPHEAAKVLIDAMRLREALYRILKPVLGRQRPEDRDLAILNEELEIARNAERLKIARDEILWDWKSNHALDKVLWMISLSAAELLTRDDLSRLRQCGGDDCGWIFLDTTRNRSRHWCDIRDCGNRDHVRRFRLRRRPQALRGRKRSSR